MAKVITIHGTNAGAESDHGDQWWQKGSAFQIRLQQLIQEPLEFEPFRWSGRNSEQDRRKAGKALARKLRKEASPPIIIGHSHGGSVVQHALFYLLLKSSQILLDHVRAVLTVGSPIIRFRGGRNWALRFNLLGQVLLFYAIITGTTVLVRAFAKTPLSPYSIFWELQAWAFAPENHSTFAGQIAYWVTGILLTPMGSTAVLILLGLYACGHRSRQRTAVFSKNKINELLSQRYEVLNHNLDEAVISLTAVTKLNWQLVTRTFARRAAIVPIAFVMLIFPAIQYATIGTFQTFGESKFRDSYLRNGETKEVPLSLRPATRDLKFPFGGAHLRTQMDQTDSLRVSATSQTAYLRSNYKIFDLGAALGIRSTDELSSFLRDPGTSNTPTYIWSARDRWPVLAAMYLTEVGQARLVHLAQNMSDNDYGELERIDVHTWTQLTWIEEYQSGSLAAKKNGTILKDVLVLNAKRSPMAQLIEQGALSDIANEVLISVTPKYFVEPTLDMATDVPKVSLTYPILRRGDPIMFERKFYTRMQVQRFLSDFLPLVSPRTEGSESTHGFIDQFEGPSISPFDAIEFLLFETQDFFFGLEINLLNTFDQFILGCEQPSTSRTCPKGLRYNDFLWFGVSGVLAFTVTILLICWIAALLLALLIAPGLSALFNNLIKRQFYGNDSYGEAVTQVAPGLDFSQHEIGTLPADVEADISSYTKQFALEAIDKFRNIVSLATMSGRLPLLTDIAEGLTWKELIHTAYFDVDSFTRHTAKILSKKAGLTLVENPPPAPAFNAELRSSALQNSFC